MQYKTNEKNLGNKKINTYCINVLDAKFERDLFNSKN